MKNLAKTSVCVALALTAIAFAGLAFVHAQSAADADFDGDGTVGFQRFCGVRRQLRDQFGRWQVRREIRSEWRRAGGFSPISWRLPGFSG